MYQKVITINHIPSGPLADYVKHVGVPKVSSFKYPAGEYCKNVILEKNGQYYLTEHHLPELISFITENGYKIDESVNKIMHRNNNVATSSDKQFLFAFS
jgi:effector-binding domain-containing protein